jgi:hypothetical protein
MTAKLTMLTHKIAIQLHLVVENCTICSSRSKVASPETFGYALVKMKSVYEVITLLTFESC